MMSIWPVPYFQQSVSGYCLPACVRMVLAYQGAEHTEQEISKILGTRKMGTPCYAVKRLAGWGYQVEYRSWSKRELLSVLDQGQPMIVFVQTIFLGYWQENVAHAIVVVGITDDQEFWVHDPAQSHGPLRVSQNGLLAAWGEFGYKGAVVQAAPKKPSRFARFGRWLWQQLSAN